MVYHTRLAPSPTGQLHLGNAWSFLLCWLAARASGGTVRLRMDDIDPQRSRKSFADAILADLAWLGLDFDGDIVWQSQRGALYEAALACIIDQDLAYPCFCTRKELRSMAGAPHVGDIGAPYAGACALLSPAERQRRIAVGMRYSWRFRCPDAPVFFDDLLQGPQTFAKMAHGGDFPLRRPDGVWAYQLATVVDDAEMGINFVLRGRDILPSTPRQLLLAQALNLPAPVYAHIPLLLDGAGERLAKRHHSLALAALRAAGMRAEQVIGLLAHLAGSNPSGKALRPRELVEHFALAQLPRANLSLGT